MKRVGFVPALRQSGHGPRVQDCRLKRLQGSHPDRGQHVLAFRTCPWQTWPEPAMAASLLGCPASYPVNNGGMMSSGITPGWMMGNPDDSGMSLMGSGSMMSGMMSGMVMNGMMDSSMMVSANNPFFVAPAPLTVTEAADILTAYLADLGDDNLDMQDLMIFDNHAYAQIIEIDSAMGVMEVLIDPKTKAVFPEMGPNMMWNLKYGMMSGFGGYGMMGMMMGGSNPMMGSGEMGVSPDQAVEKAQAYLDRYFSEAGLTADEHADPFYGYFTLHVKREDKTVGMLSVNGYSGQVCPHTWHGVLLEMAEGE